jgi:hypothetical protein
VRGQEEYGEEEKESHYDVGLECVQSLEIYPMYL